MALTCSLLIFAKSSPLMAMAIHLSPTGVIGYVFLFPCWDGPNLNSYSYGACDADDILIGASGIVFLELFGGFNFIFGQSP